MKKTALVLLFAVISVHVFSQRGDLAVGVKGAYVISSNDLKYKGVLYGFDVAYHLSDPLEVAFTGLINPDISRREDNKSSNLAVYSANLDLRLYLIHQQDWATGPALGGQYYIANNKTDNLGADKALGFNIGWCARVNLTDNLKLNGGWRYTNAKSKDKSNWWSSDASFDMSHHMFYLGLAYTFELK